jgi:carbamoyltransferase
MSTSFGRYGPTHPRLGALTERVSRPLLTAYAARHGFHAPDSAFARERGAAFAEKLRLGERVYIVGIGPAGHNSGVALVEASRDDGVRLICNNEEERYSGIKHCTAFPEQSLDALLTMMARRGIDAGQIHAFVAGWDYITLATTLLRGIAEELPASRVLLGPANFAPMNARHITRALKSPDRLGRQLGLDHAMPIIGMRHHCNHAYFSYAVSPFAGSEEPVMISVLDGIGDDGAISLYIAQGDTIRLVHRNRDIFDSLGGFYSMISSTQGGWTILSSEGRYMGSAAWGDSNRLTNPYYCQLRELFHFAGDGTVRLNRALANWPRSLQIRPYTTALLDILGPPIPAESMWNPDAVMRVDIGGETVDSQERFDKAAATQLVFEDALFHIIGHLIRTTGSKRLVLTGGTALNAIANMRLMDHFEGLHVWVPPVPGDPGVAVGVAYHFALANGAPLGVKLGHAFYCGIAPSSDEIETALRGTDEIAWVELGNTSDRAGRERIADLLALCIAHDGVLGLFQGPAETGPRALGHRSILANPTNPRTLETINRLVKFREPFRPLAPMLTLEAAHRWFELQEGASDDDYNAYSYMALTVRARPHSARHIPAVIHRDGTSRIQIVRADTDPFTHAYLRAMGRRCGVEVSVNTSLNVAGPIVQTPQQALEALRRSKAMDGVLLIGAEGDAWLAWHAVATPPKDGGRRLGEWLREWQAASLPSPAFARIATSDAVPVVMAGLVPAIPISAGAATDGRDTPGHDGQSLDRMDRSDHRRRIAHDAGPLSREGREG